MPNQIIPIVTSFGAPLLPDASTGRRQLEASLRDPPTLSCDSTVIGCKRGFQRQSCRPQRMRWTARPAPDEEGFHLRVWVSLRNHYSDRALLAARNRSPRAPV